MEKRKELLVKEYNEILQMADQTLQRINDKIDVFNKKDKILLGLFRVAKADEYFVLELKQLARVKGKFEEVNKTIENLEESDEKTFNKLITDIKGSKVFLNSINDTIDIPFQYTKTFEDFKVRVLNVFIIDLFDDQITIFNEQNKDLNEEITKYKNKILSKNKLEKAKAAKLLLANEEKEFRDEFHAIDKKDFLSMKGYLIERIIDFQSNANEYLKTKVTKLRYQLLPKLDRLDEVSSLTDPIVKPVSNKTNKKK